MHSYTDEALAIMPPEPTPQRVTRITLRPRIGIRRPGTCAAGDEDVLRAKVERFVRIAHNECFIANSLTATIDVEPTILLTD